MSSIFSERVLRLPDDVFAAAFHADVEAYSAWISGRNRLGGSLPTGSAKGQKTFNNSRPICLRTLTGHRSAIYLAASAVARSGVEPSSLKSIAAVASPEAVELLLAEIVGRGRYRASLRCSSYDARNLYCTVTAQRLRSIALSWCSDLTHRKTEYAEIISRFKPLRNIQQGTTSKNADRLRQFEAPDVLHNWFQLPERLLQRSEHVRIKTKTVTPRMIADVQSAVALALLQALPMRGSNLARLRIGNHPHIIFSRQGANLLIRGEEVKNRQDLSARIGGRALSILLLYATRYLPDIKRRTGAHEDNPFLFPARGMRGKTLVTISENIKSRAWALCGLRLNLHLLRHLAAKIIADRAPREIDAISGLLGHAQLETTQRFYLTPDKSAVRNRYRRLVDTSNFHRTDQVTDGTETGSEQVTSRGFLIALQERVAANPGLLKVARLFGWAGPRLEEIPPGGAPRDQTKLSAALYAFRLFAQITSRCPRTGISAERRMAEAVDQFVAARRQHRAELTVLSNLEGLTLAFRALHLERETEFLRRYARRFRHEACFPGKGKRNPNAWCRFEGWPTQAKEAWLRSTEPMPIAPPIAKGGSSFRPRWSQATQRNVHYVYSRFLRHVGDAGMPARISPDTVQTFIDHLVSRGSATGSILSAIRNLYAAARVVAADEDLTWLNGEVNRWKHLARRELGRRSSKTIDPAEVWTAGRSLISRARASGETDYVSSILFRDGLILCMATAVPVRAGLLMRFVVHEGEVFLDPTHGGMTRVELQHWPELIADIRDFETRYRGLFLPEHTERALWLSAMGRPLGRRQFAHIVRKRSTELFGSPLSLATLRAGVVQLYLLESPEHIDDVAIMLGYYGTSVLERLRARANQLIDQEKAVRIIEECSRPASPGFPA